MIRIIPWIGRKVTFADHGNLRLGSLQSIRLQRAYIIVGFDHSDWRQMMLSKETFCTALRMIKEQEKIDEAFTDALALICDGHSVYGTKNKCLSALRLVLKEAVHDRYWSNAA